MKTFRIQRTHKLVGIGIFLLFLLPAAWATVTLPFYEPFGEWNEMENLGARPDSGGPGNSGVNVWTFGNTVTTSSAHITTNAALSVIWMAGDTNVPPKGIRANGTGKNRGFLFDTQYSSGSVYASFLMQVLTNPPAPRIIACLSTSFTGSGIPNPDMGVFVDDLGELKITKNNGISDPPGDTPPTSALVTSNTYFVVIRYTFNPNDNDDEVALWLSPTSLGDDSNVPDPTITYVGSGPDAPFIQSFCYMSPTAMPIIGLNMDEIRVATNWAGVTPIPPPPGPKFNVTGGGTSCPPWSFPVGLTNSVTTNDYWLLKDGLAAGQVLTGTGTNISFTPVTNSGVYTVLASNTVTGDLLGAVGLMNGQAIVVANIAPLINLQPTNVFGAILPVATNAQSTLSALAIGGGLTFQWRKNNVPLTNGGHYSGVTTSNLTINPTTSADAATTAQGYDCFIHGACSPDATTGKIGLANVPPRTLYWVGQLPDGVTAAPAWDVTATTNWTTCQGCSSIRGFEFGDNVRFDDNAIGTINVIVGSSFLTPTLITLKTYQNYSFSGPGSIVGSGSAVFMGYSGGTLSITNANYYTGGTTISNILVNIANNSAFGLGPVTLKTNAILNPYGVLNITNDIVVTDNSTIQVNNTSQSALTLGGALSGTGGTLTFYNNISAGPQIRLMNTNFTFNRPINLSWINTNTGNSLFTTNIMLSGYNTNGNQIFNGVISGPSMLGRRASGGNTILNAQNTYTNGTLLGDGGIGFGASSTGNPITSGPIGTGPLFLEGSGTMSVFAWNGAQTVANPIIFITNNNATPQALAFTGANRLTLSGGVSLNGTNRPIRVDNTNAASIISGVIDDGAAGYGIIKLGVGPLTLTANNTYSGPTTVSNGTLLVNGQIGSGAVTVVGAGGTNGAGILGGTGTIAGPVTVASGGTLSPGTNGIGTLSPGTNGIGTLTINNTLTFQSGSTAYVEVNKSTGTNDLVTGLTSVTYGGTLFVTNLSGTLTTSDSFKLFSAASYSGAFDSVIPAPGANLLWDTSTLTNGILSIKTGSVKQVPTNVYIGSVQILNRTNIVINGTNSSGSGYTLSLLSSTNVATRLTNWVLESYCTTNGLTFNVTNNMTSGLPRKFYTIQAQ